MVEVTGLEPVTPCLQIVLGNHPNLLNHNELLDLARSLIWNRVE